MEIYTYIIDDYGYDLEFNEEYSESWKKLLTYPDESATTDLIIRSYCDENSPNSRRYFPYYIARFHTPNGTKIGASISTTDYYRTSIDAYKAFINKYPWIYGLD